MASFKNIPEKSRPREQIGEKAIDDYLSEQVSDPKKASFKKYRGQGKRR